MFEKTPTPPKKNEAMSEALDLVMDMMIEAETDPRHKAQMLVMRQCKKLSHKFVDIAGEYGQFSNEEITETDAKNMLEYLLLVEGGIDTYLASEKGASDE